MNKPGPNDRALRVQSRGRGGTLLGAQVQVDMIGYEGNWTVVKDDGAKVLLQRPELRCPRWVMRRYVKAANDPVSHAADAR